MNTKAKLKQLKPGTAVDVSSKMRHGYVVSVTMQDNEQYVVNFRDEKTQQVRVANLDDVNVSSLQR